MRAANKNVVVCCGRALEIHVDKLTKTATDRGMAGSAVCAVLLDSGRRPTGSAGSRSAGSRVK